VTDGAPVPGGGDWNVECRVAYTNVLNVAVGAPPAVSTVPFFVDFDSPPISTARFDTNPRVYPQDPVLIESFEAYVDTAGLGDTFDDVCSVAPLDRTPECATFILEHLDDWTGWYTAESQVTGWSIPVGLGALHPVAPRHVVRQASQQRRDLVALLVCAARIDEIRPPFRAAGA
jgi:hypothetical protein